MGTRRAAVGYTSLHTPEGDGARDAILHWATRLDRWLVQWMARVAPVAMRIGLGVVFCWFGALKFVPGSSPAEELATRTMDVLTFGVVPPHIAIVVLAAWESIIGIGLILNVAMRLTLGLLFLQMIGTFTPLFLFPHELFTQRLCAPTLEGQYIIKNLVLISAGLALGGMLRGGEIVADPSAE